MTFRHFLMKPIKILEDMLPVPTEEELKIHMEQGKEDSEETDRQKQLYTIYDPLAQISSYQRVNFNAYKDDLKGFKYLIELRPLTKIVAFREFFSIPSLYVNDKELMKEYSVNSISQNIYMSLLFILRNEEIYQQIKNENSEINSEKKLQLINQFVLETIRYYPPIPYSQKMELQRDFQLGDFKIKNKMRIQNNFVMHNFNKNYFEQPFEHNYKRWGNIKNYNNELLKNNLIDNFIFQNFGEVYIVEILKSIIINQNLKTLNQNSNIQMKFRSFYNPVDFNMIETK
ncbi:Cytochrome P450 [Pseudocohnilembus persalinus]|uniref:Cytochrome P450 n=1 Tax=Pseudocohnilembus persalinus TaxID=266149 RepID=A0A0V0QST3_PSEPJ|nr:Cytochrome P450 [Pseudocohnilembus persalinus]|eukprot:KRX05050.1 Cytochrome P450 [Pseudocohnilembus persalinus]